MPANDSQDFRELVLKKAFDFPGNENVHFFCGGWKKIFFFRKGFFFFFS